MKKLLIHLSLLISSNAIVTPTYAELNEQIVPALKIAGGTLAAATAVGYAAMIPALGPIPVPAVTSAAILSAMAFGLTKDITVNPAIKIAGCVTMGLSAYFYANAVYYLNDPYYAKDETFLEQYKGTLVAGPATICTATLAALSFASLLNDQKFIESLKYIFC